MAKFGRATWAAVLIPFVLCFGVAAVFAYRHRYDLKEEWMQRKSRRLREASRGMDMGEWISLEESSGRSQPADIPTTKKGQVRCVFLSLDSTWQAKPSPSPKLFDHINPLTNRAGPGLETDHGKVYSGYTTRKRDPSTYLTAQTLESGQKRQQAGRRVSPPSTRKHESVQQPCPRSCAACAML
jgi:hypothetical protein